MLSLSLVQRLAAGMYMPLPRIKISGKNQNRASGASVQGHKPRRRAALPALGSSRPLAFCNLVFALLAVGAGFRTFGITQGVACILPLSNEAAKLPFVFCELKFLLLRARILQEKSTLHTVHSTHSNGHGASVRLRGGERWKNPVGQVEGHSRQTVSLVGVASAS